METKVIWKEGLSFDGTAETGFTVPLGAAAKVGGADDGFRPMELIAVGLAGCTGMDVISILRKKRQDIRAFEVRVHAEQSSDHPHVFTRIRIEYVITGNNINEAAVQRAIELSETKYCPAQAMFKQVAPMELDYTIQPAEA